MLMAADLGASCILRLEDGQRQTSAALSTVHPHSLRACIVTSGQLQDSFKPVQSILQVLSLPSRSYLRVSPVRHQRMCTHGRILTASTRRWHVGTPAWRNRKDSDNTLRDS